jgi:hypothetical protein
MKRIVIFCLLLTVFSGAFAQKSISPDIRLTAVYSQEFLDNLLVENPDQLRYLNWYLDNSYRIIEAGVDKCALMQPLVSFNPLTKTEGDAVSSIDEESFNVYLYSVELQYDKKTYYRIGSTGFAVEFESLKKLAEKYNNYNNEN